MQFCHMDLMMCDCVIKTLVHCHLHEMWCYARYFKLHDTLHSQNCCLNLTNTKSIVDSRGKKHRIRVNHCSWQFKQRGEIEQFTVWRQIKTWLWRDLSELKLPYRNEHIIQREQHTAGMKSTQNGPEIHYASVIAGHCTQISHFN